MFAVGWVGIIFKRKERKLMALTKVMHSGNMTIEKRLAFTEVYSVVYFKVGNRFIRIN